ncbi:MAG: SPASM domain-containing protein [Gemmatimonadota bacterium]|nr:MAG: SPASM domain-containing protein [Gemmatimonadota bacterium]
MIRSAMTILRRHATTKKAVNVLIVLVSYLLSKLIRRPIAWGHPFMLMVEPTNMCNLKCPLCPTGSDSLTRPKGKMSYEHFVHLIDEVHEHLLLLSLWNVGEPFLNESFIKMIRFAKRKNIYVITSTNGHFLGTREKVRDLILSGLDELIVSMDGASSETYNRFRQNGQFQTVVDGLRGVTDEKNILKSASPRIDLQFIVMRHNEHEVKAMEDLARELKVDKLTLKTVQVTNVEEAEEFLPTQQEFRRYLFHGDTFRMRGKLKNNCRWLWFCPVVNWNGTVVPCCFDKDNEFTFGNVFEESSLENIWQNEQYSAFRRNILSDRKAYALCTNCSEGIKSLYIKKERLT